MPYVADQLNVDILRADASVKGAVRYASTPVGAQVQLKVDAALDEFQANSVLTASNTSLPGGETWLRWKSLNVPGIDVDMQPNTPPRVQVREAALTDFYARVVVNPQGRLNLQDVVRAKAGEPVVAPLPSSNTNDRSALISVGPVSLVNGRVLFSDRFIQPIYSADLTQLTGKLSQFSSQPRNGVVQLADLELCGRAEGTASLEITGKLNPLAKPLALDIQGRVRDLELPPLSPYAIKYAGYGIERGKMSVDVNYTIKPDGQLTASNKLVLNQLSFGDKVEGAPNSLPVKLAVALLADHHGVIDLNLPISGSLNDPQFSIGPVIWKALTNLIAKAITSPFSLLANAFGGGEELSAVVFPAGGATLTSDAKQSLDKVAKALSDRTALTMTIVGTASLEAERDALKKDQLNASLLSEKRRRAVVAGQDAATVVAEDPAEMQALLLANISVNEDSVRALALARGVVVRDYLAARNVPTDRLFLGAAKTVAPSADWQPRADLTLNSQ
jgi:stage V sporulation protein SpoVS